MQVSTGKVVGGRIVLEGEPLAEGSIVTVLSRESKESFSLSADDERELRDAMAALDHGEFLTLEQLNESLRPFD